LNRAARRLKHGGSGARRLGHGAALQRRHSIQGRSSVISTVAIAQLPAPPLISRAEAERTATASSWSFLAESRRADNGRMLRELKDQLEYRYLDFGIRASLDEDEHPTALQD
jgi:hypothetical protein